MAFIVDDSNLMSEALLLDAKRAISQFTSGYIRGSSGAIDLYFFCHKSGVETTAGKAGNGYCNLQHGDDVDRIFSSVLEAKNFRRETRVSTSPYTGCTLLNVLWYYCQRLRAARRRTSSIKPLHVVVISSALPIHDPDFIACCGSNLDNVGAPAKQLFLYFLRASDEDDEDDMAEWDAFEVTLGQLNMRDMCYVIRCDYVHRNNQRLLDARGIRTLLGLSQIH